MPTPEQVAAVTALAVSIAYVTTFIVQFFKDTLIDPRMADTPARSALLRGISYALNFGFLIGALAIAHQFDPTLLLLYATVALGQFGLSHAGYAQLSGGANPKGGMVGSGSDVGGDTVAHG
jgi:hypothetical protein